MRFWGPFAGTLLACASIFIAQETLAQSVTIPAQPELQLRRAERYQTPSGVFVRWYIEVVNRDAYPDEMFALSPDLPPCGRNENASRTWVDFFDSDDQRLFGFCSLTGSDPLVSLWFVTPIDQLPPSSAYVVFTDRLTGETYGSEPVDLAAEALVSQAAVLRASGDESGAFRLLERAIHVQGRTGPVDQAWYDEALSFASSVAPD